MVTVVCIDVIPDSHQPGPMSVAGRDAGMSVLSAPQLPDRTAVVSFDAIQGVAPSISVVNPPSVPDSKPSEYAV
jgi:hypothetical protein